MDTDGTDNHQAIELMDTQETDMLDSNMTTGTEDATMQQESNQMDATAVPDTNAENIEDEVRSEATFDFKIPNFSKLKDSVLSPPVMVRNLPWKIMALQRNERNSSESKALGFFLQCNGESDLTNWSCNAVAELRLKSWIPGQEPFSRKIKHVFYSKENDWGFSYFIGWNEIMDPEKGYIKDDTIVLEVHVAAEAPHGVFWDSKKHTGYVGLKNQGATCYMNSLLQTLCFTNQLRKAVYKMPTEADDSTKSVGLALQRVFHDLQFMDKPVGTKKLTKSFGWETLDSFMQHDVQEFLRVLLDKLESKMKGTCVEGTVPHLFEGKMKSYIKCKNVDCTSNRLETFYDIQLNIKGKKNIYESFQDYIAAETLEGDNKYDAGVHGLQDAEKGVIFKSFPPVLHLHLMRFQYDPITDSSVKFNDRFEFHETINLDPYLDQKDPKNPAVYKLHAVLVHSGDNHGGHYVVYINPNADGRWCKFDDDVVSSCSKTEAIEHNYGGVDDEMAINAKHCSNAYMLVYIRTSEIPMVLEQITAADIPVELTQRLNEEKRLEIARRKERTEANLMIHIHVILEEVFESHASPDLFDFEHTNYHQIRMKKSQTVDELLGILSQTFKVAQNRIRIWPLYPHRTQGQKFVYFDVNEDIHKQLINVDSPWYIYMEMLRPDCPGIIQPFDKKRDVFLFFKFYDPIKKSLTYLDHGQYQLATRVCDLIPHINKILGFDATTELSVYEECPSNSVQKINNMNETLDKALTQQSRDNSIQGFILIFEKKIALNNSDSVDGFISNQQNVVVHPQFHHLKLELPTVDHYFRDLLHRVEILFVDKTVANDPGFTLEISNRLSCTQMAQAVAEKINTDPNRIQFFKCVGYKDTPGNALRPLHEGSIKDLLAHGKPRITKKVFYQILSMDINELENKRQFKCLFLSSNLKDEKELVLYPNKTGTVKTLLEEASKIIEFSEDSTRKLRLVEVSSHKILSPPKEDTALEDLQSSNDTITNQNPQKIYRIEEVPKEDLIIGDNEMLIPVSHFSKEIYNTFGTPFFIKTHHGETYGALKERIQKRLNVPDKEWEKYKFAVVALGRIDQVNDDNMTVNLESYRCPNHGGPLPFFGLEHINKSQKRTRYNYLEKAIKIYN